MKELEERYEIAVCIARKIAGTSTQEEEDKLGEWRSASEANAREYDVILQRLRTDLREKERPDVAGEWLRFESTICKHRKVYRWWYSAAAVIAGVGLVVGLLWMRPGAADNSQQAMGNVKSYKAVLILNNGKRIDLTENYKETITGISGTRIVLDGNCVCYDADSLVNQQGDEMNTVVVPRGGEYELLLADGTRVWLNSESQLTYPVRFTGDNREVAMKGEVCFDVARNEKQPFVVKTADVSVTVLGTLFNMEAYPEDHRTTATLVRGKIEVNSGEEKQVITPDRQAIVDANGRIQVKKVYGEDYVSWTNGVFHFTEASLDEIMTRLARWYDVECFFSHPALKDAHFTLDIQRYDHVSAILSKIEKTGRVRFRVNGKTVLVQE